jgi:hypothetical protein
MRGKWVVENVYRHKEASLSPSEDDCTRLLSHANDGATVNTSITPRAVIHPHVGGSGTAIARFCLCTSGLLHSGKR